MAANGILNIGSLALRDDTIIKKEFYPYSPYTTTLGASDEIRIVIQNQESYMLPCESYLFLQLRATTVGAHAANDAEVHFVENFASFLFTNVRYELNGVEIDRMRNVGRSSLMKLLLASRTIESFPYKSLCDAMKSTSPRHLAAPRLFDVMIPLSVWFGFCDDYRKIIINSKHELILNRSANSLNCVTGGGDAETASRVTLELMKIQWKMPHIILSDNIKLKMMNYLSKNRKIIIQHRSADFVVYPALPETTNHMWTVKTVSHVNRPRYVVVGFQTNRDNLHTSNAALFDHCHVTEVRLYMNSQIYPYNMNEIQIHTGRYCELYDMYARIQASYYNNTEPSNFFALSYIAYQSSPIFAFDTSRADESLLDSSVDIRVEIKTSQNIPANTAAFCLIIYDNEFTYSPFDGIVVRNI